VGAAVMAVTIGAGPAQAGAPLDHGTYHDVDPGTSTAGDPEWPCKALGFDVTISLDLHGSYRFGPRKSGGTNFDQFTEHGWIAFSANGSTYMSVHSILNKDMDVTENEDGSLSIIVMGTGTDKWFLNGELLYNNPGQNRVEILITDPGEETENVTFVRVVKESTGLINGPTRSFCEDLADFLAPAP
jgi:hypothetical protein